MNKRVLIVEDDKFFRFAVKKFVDWNKYGFELTGEAVHGAAALEFIASQDVDVVITDMNMPIMDGIELTAKLREKYPDIMIIALSAYDDFQLVKEAMRLGASDYILKQNIEKEDVGLQINNAWEHHMDMLAKDSRMKEGIVKFIHHEKKENTAREENYLNHLLDGETGWYMCILQDMGGWKKKINTDELETKSRIIPIYNGEYILFCKARDTHSTAAEIENKSCIARQVGSILCEEKYIGGISRKIIKVSQIPSVYHELKKVMGIGRFEKKSRILIWDNISTIKRIPDFMKQSETYGDIYTCEQAQNAVSMLTEEMRQSMPDDEYVQKNYLGLVNQIAGNVKYVIENIDFANLKAGLERIYFVEDKQILIEKYLKKIFEECECRKWHAEVVQSMRFMKENYDQDISLNEIADAVSMSESYLSSLFKKESGYSITEYLNKIRIEKAKELIKTTNLKNYEIGDRVGISNPSYFSTVFKKEAEITIQEYRQVVLKKTNEIEKF